MSSSDEKRNVHAEWIERAKHHSGLNGSELGLELGVGETVVSKWLRGKLTPPRHIQDGLRILAGYGHDNYLAGPPALTPDKPIAEGGAD